MVDISVVSRRAAPTLPLEGLEASKRRGGSISPLDPDNQLQKSLYF